MDLLRGIGVAGTQDQVTCMKLHELHVGTRFCFAGGDIDYKVVKKTKTAIHFVRFDNEPAYIVTPEYEKSWNAIVEIA